MPPGQSAESGQDQAAQQLAALVSGAPDQYADEARRHAADLQRAMQRDRQSETRKLARIRLILRRVLGRENPSGSS
jgi:hypothetical protein